MPACGKSTIGVLLAKTLGLGFTDTDLIIQLQNKNTLQRLIDINGLDKFKEYENSALLSVSDESDTVVATGGSAIFCEKGMRHLKCNGVCGRGGGLEEIFKEREPLYNKYADIKINCADKTCEQIVEKIAGSVR